MINAEFKLLQIISHLVRKHGNVLHFTVENSAQCKIVIAELNQYDVFKSAMTTANNELNFLEVGKDIDKFIASSKGPTFSLHKNTFALQLVPKYTYLLRHFPGFGTLWNKKKKQYKVLKKSDHVELLVATKDYLRGQLGVVNEIAENKCLVAFNDLPAAWVNTRILQKVSCHVIMN